MRYSYLPMFLLAVLGLGISECPEPDCPQPAEGILAAGTWGGDNWNFDVDQDGVMYVRTYCASGNSEGPVIATDGNVAFAADMIFEMGGPGRPGVAKFEGQVCGDTFEFTYTTEYGYEETATVVYGEKGEVVACPYL